MRSSWGSLASGARESDGLAINLPRVYFAPDGGETRIMMMTFFSSSLFPSLYFPRYDRCDSGIHGLLEVAHIKESNNYVQKRRGKSDDKFMNSSRQQMDCPRAANRVTLSLQIAYTGRTRQAIYLLLLIQMHLVDLQTSMNSDFDRLQKSILRITMGYETVVHISLSRPTNSW